MLSLVVFALFLPAIFGEQTQDPVEAFHEYVAKEVETLWTTMDYNKNGHYDRQDLGMLIANYDNDGDQEVTKPEFVLHFDMEEPTLAIVADALFLEYDDNGDGFFDNDDLDDLYDRIDQDGDGMISKHEFTEYHTQLLTILFILQSQHME